MDFFLFFERNTQAPACRQAGELAGDSFDICFKSGKRKKEVSSFLG